MMFVQKINKLNLHKDSMKGQNIFLICIGMMVLFSSVPLVSAGSFADFLNDLGLGTFFRINNHDPQYSQQVELDAVFLEIGDQECLYTSSNEQIEFEVYSGNNLLVRGLIKSSDSHCFSSSNTKYDIFWKRWAIPNVIPEEGSKTHVYRCSQSVQWVYWGYFAKGALGASQPYWCSDSSKNGYLDLYNNFHCASSPNPDWCGGSVRDSTWCMLEKGGRVSLNECGDEAEEGALIRVLDDGSNCCESRNLYGLDDAGGLGPVLDDPVRYLYDEPVDWIDDNVVTPVAEVVDNVVTGTFDFIKWIFWIAVALAILYALSMILRLVGR